MGQLKCVPYFGRSENVFNIHGAKRIECVQCHAIKNKIKNHATDKVKKNLIL